MPRTLIPICLALLSALAGGCSFFSREISLKPVPCKVQPSEKISGIPFSIRVSDEREGDHNRIGATGWSLANLVTKNDVAAWISEHIAKALTGAGGKPERNAGNRIACSVKECETSWGWWSNIISNLAIDVSVANGEREKKLGELKASVSFFSLIDTNERFEKAIAGALEEWIATHSATIIDAIAEVSKTKPPTKKPATEPERKPIIRLPAIRITSPQPGKKLEKRGLVVTGEAINAVGANLTVKLNGQSVKSQKITGAGEKFKTLLWLRPGHNRIEVVLLPKKGDTVTRGIDAFFEPPPLGDRGALVLGVGKFKDLPASAGAEKAAWEIFSLLRDAQEPKQAKRVRPLGQEARLAELQAGMQAVLAEADEDDGVILFYAGSVISVYGEHAFALHDTDAKEIRTSLLLSDIVMDVERYFKGKTVLLIAQGREGEPAPEELDLGGLGGKLSVLLFAPAGGNAGAVAAALSGAADSDVDGYVTLEELRRNLKDKGKALFSGPCDPSFKITRVKLSGN